MKVTIGDMDYYYAAEKVNCFNPDVMKIASYHRQLGDQINFVTTQDDIYRPYELYYIIKNNSALPHPPLDFFTNKRVKWWGKAYRARIKGTMSNAMLACRPDYLIYPEKNTIVERAEHVRFFNNNAEPLLLTQEWRNTFKRKMVLVTDPFFGCAAKKDILGALEQLIESPNVGFLEPIWIQKIIYNEDIKKLFFKLKLSRNVKLDGTTIKTKDIDGALLFLRELKNKFPTLKVDGVVLDYHTKERNHGESKEHALQDFALLKQTILTAKVHKLQVIIKMPVNRYETPYFALFETLSLGTRKYFKLSGIEFLAYYYGGCSGPDLTDYLCHPDRWHELFRDFLRQTYADSAFLTAQGGANALSEVIIPGNLFETEFKYGL